MTTAFRGRDFVLKIGDGGSPEAFSTVAGLRSTGLTINNNPVDITNVASEGFQELLADGGVQSFEFRGQGIVVSDADMQALADQARLRTTKSYQITSAFGDTFEGSLIIASFERSGSYDGAEEFTVTLQSTGSITYVAASP